MNKDCDKHNELIRGARTITSQYEKRKIDLKNGEGIYLRHSSNSKANGMINQYTEAMMISKIYRINELSKKKGEFMRCEKYCLMNRIFLVCQVMRLEVIRLLLEVICILNLTL